MTRISNDETVVGGARDESMRRRPRILFLTFDVDYMSPTRQQIKKALVSGCDVVLFGPGHSSWEDVAAGPASFVERHGPFDIVMGDENALIPPPKSECELPDRSFLNHACSFDRSLIWKGAEYYEFLRAYDGTRVISLMQSDFYNFPPEQIEWLEQNGDYFMLFGEELVLPKGAADRSMMLPGLVNEKIFNAWTDRYLEFLRRNKERIISTPHVVDLYEFFDRRLIRRPFEWSVLGASYDSRRIARQKLDAAKIRRSGKLLHLLVAGSEHTPMNIYAHRWSINFSNQAFRRALRQSRYSFTCGSVTRYGIRKFYEIPANGCVLVTDPCQGFGALGFVHEKNALICDPRDILDVHAWLEADIERAQTIADEGRTLVYERHSVPARAKQFQEVFDRIFDGSFRGSYWKDGGIVFRQDTDS